MAKSKKKISIFNKLRNYFFAGIVVLVPIGFTIWFFRLFIELIAYLRLAINVNAKPIYVPIIKTAEELANEEIKSIRE